MSSCQVQCDCLGSLQFHRSLLEVCRIISLGICRHLVRRHAISVLNHCLSWYKFVDTHLLPLQTVNQCDTRCAQNSTVDIWLTLIDGRVQLRLHVTSGNVSLTSDPVMPTYDLLNTNNDDSPCSFQVDIVIDRNQVTMTGSLFTVFSTLLLSHKL